MTDPKAAIRQAFLLPTQFLARVTTQGFLVDDQPVAELSGRLHQLRLVRKLFANGALACDSPDGVEARNATLGDPCRHPRCRPPLRIVLDRGTVHYLLDVNATSARNLLALEDELATEGIPIEGCPLKLTVVSRGHWPEVRFHRL
jgi:hypothetical protein